MLSVLGAGVMLVCTRNSTSRDYQDKNQKLEKFIQAFQNSQQVRNILDKDFGKDMWFAGWK